MLLRSCDSNLSNCNHLCTVLFSRHLKCPFIQFLQVRFDFNLLLPFPKSIRRPNDNLRFQQQLLLILCLSLRIIQPRFLGLRQQQYRQQILGLRLRHGPQPLVPILPKHPRRPTLDERDLGQVEQVGFRARFESIDHVLERGLEHAPAHFVAEMDHARGEAFADLGKGLHEAAGNVVLAGDEVDGRLVAEVAELESGVEAAVDA